MNKDFNEEQWLKLLFLLADTQTWLDDMAKEFFCHLPLQDKKRFFRKSYYLTVLSLAHIIERHYYKINRYPHAGKFHIPVMDLLNYIREAGALPTTSVPWCMNFQRTIRAEQNIGFDKNGAATDIITVLTDGGGKIITAYPGHPLVIPK